MKWRSAGTSSNCATIRAAAGIEVAGSFDEAANRAFGPLAGYINGANRSRRRMAMTAPGGAACRRPTRPLPGAVRDAISPHRRDDAHSPGCPGANPGAPAGLAAVLRFSGRWTHKAFEERGAALRRAVVASGLRPADPMRYARFNPPWTPWFTRRNEVVLPTRGVATAAAAGCAICQPRVTRGS